MFKLTAKEEEVMEHIWTLGTCAPKDVVALYPDDERPHINSVANAFQSLEKKGYLTHRQQRSLVNRHGMTSSPFLLV